MLKGNPVSNRLTHVCIYRFVQRAKCRLYMFLYKYNKIKCIKDGGILFAGNWSRFTDECVVQLHTEGCKSAIKKKK